ncbi:MAG: hydrogen gas-evolving membrane-bound hydrogenase subunit E [Acidimicrobiia bacterium]|nr:hydrogen gas-evolving membrane-bound hydrogenase subunit E [Acidimicrobiia bacterium]
MIVLLLAHFAAAALLPVLGPGRRSVAVAAAPPAASLAWLVTAAPDVLDGTPRDERWAWVPDLGIAVDLRLDATALLLGLLVTAIGVGVVLYSGRYLGATPAATRFLASLVAFAGSMLGLVLSDHLVTLYLFWELTTVTSYLLIGHDTRSPAALAAARQAALVTVMGGLAMLGGIVVLGAEAGTLRLSELTAAPPSGTATSVALVLILLGAVTKSAQFPFHAWLPGAMAAPTPASAYLHSATMVKAGIFLLLQLAPVAAAVGFWTPTVATLGTVTLFLGGWRALREHDLKRILAYGTLAQLGLLTLTAGVGTPAAVTAGLAMLLAHALFKAALFLVVGAVDAATGTRDVRRLAGLRHSMPALAAVAALAGASMAGIPPLLGFVAKESVLDALLASDPLLAWIVAAGSVLTVAYTGRVLAVFVGPPVDGVRPERGRRLAAVPALLAVAGIVLGVAPDLAKGLADPAGEAVTGVADAVKIVLWPGITPALGLSALSLALGAALVVSRRRVDRGLAALPRLPDAAAVFEGTVTGLLRLATRSTAVFQSGSLPVYLGVVLAAVLAVPGVALLGAFEVPDDAVAVEGWVQGSVLGLMAVSTLALLIARRRLAALLLLGAVGYGMAALFVIQGAPDLALTQLLIETVGLVVLAVVLYRMPLRFPGSSWRPARVVRAVLSVGVGVFVTAAILSAGSPSPVTDTSAAYLERSKPDAGGSNVVNVVLTDFRALDTFGEITVLTTAALGVVGLLAGLRERRR